MKVIAKQKTKNFNHELDFKLGRRLFITFLKNRSARYMQKALLKNGRSIALNVIQMCFGI
jgi:phosphoserine phosphatase